MIKVGINGFGRIGSLAFRAAIKSDDIEVVGINAPGKTPGQLAYAVKYDTVHGRFDGTVAGDDEKKVLIVDGKEIPVLDSRDPSVLPWGELGAEYVLECTGKFLTKEGETLDSALRRFKRQMARSNVLAELRKRECYEKPSVKRKKKSEAARKRSIKG